MGFRTAFLSLCLLASVQVTAQDGSLQAISAYEVKSLVAATTDGAAVSVPDMSWDVLTTYPSSDWYVNAWVQILAGTPDTAQLLAVSASDGTNPLDCYVVWKSTDVPTFTFGVTDHTVTGTSTFRQEGAWVFILMGSSGHNSFGYVNFRDNFVSQLSVSWSETVYLTLTSSLKAPKNASPFSVSSK